MLIIADHLWGILTVWQEARGEAHTGRVAVAEVIVNRAKHKYFSDGTIAGTCLKPWQFSGFNTTDPNRLLSAKIDDTDPVVEDCLKSWDEAILNVTSGQTITKDALLYLNPATVTKTPDWVANSTEVAVIGHHHFYIPKGN